MVIYIWSIKRICQMIENMIANKFDCIIIIDGNRGLGKSTLAIKISRGCKKFHKFSFEKDLLYSRKSVIKAFNSRRLSNFIADEMVNVAFGRDFWSGEQKDLVKIMNMDRDHCNLFIACVPVFATLDKQIKEMCKIRITVVRRGLGIIQTKNASIYSRDKWDQAVNEKIEKSWTKTDKPKFAKLTTFRGLIKFSDMTPKQRKIYVEIKERKRNAILGMGKDDLIEEETLTPQTKGFKLLLDGKIKNRTDLERMCVFMNLKPENFIQNFRRHLRNKHDKRLLADFFTEEKEKLNQKQKEQAEVKDLLTLNQ